MVLINLVKKSFLRLQCQWTTLYCTSTIKNIWFEYENFLPSYDGHLVVTRMRKKSVLLNVNWNNLERKKDAVFALPDSEVGNLFRGYVHNLRPTTNIFFFSGSFFFSIFILHRDIAK